MVAGTGRRIYIYIVYHDLFKDVVSKSDYIPLHHRMIVTDELESIWKGTIVA
jgi:hypothetical protein